MQHLRQQRGGTFLGFVLGLVTGLGVALAVAVYVTKVPIPFVNKATHRTPDQEATELEKNKEWNPNAPLQGKNPAKPAVPPAAEPTVQSAPAVVEPVAAKAPATKAAGAAEVKPAVTADPLGDLAKARAAKAAPADAADPFTYFVQVGAFRTPEDAESQRAKLSLAGIDTKVTEREQAGRTVYRVRQGPFDKSEDAEKAKRNLEGKGIEAALVRVQR